jgi:hypothetical protein
MFYNWGKGLREGFVFIIVGIIALSFPMAGLIKTFD